MKPAPGPPLYLAVAAHFVALGQALLLGGGGGLPELDEVAQGDVHRAVGLQFACSGTRMSRGEGRTVASGGDYRGAHPPVIRYSFPLACRDTPHTAEVGAV